MGGRLALEQAILNHRKVVRTAIRLKHSIAADNELNELMPVVERRLTALAQQGRIPQLSIAQLMDIAESGGVDEPLP